jgi:hypothetical protein
MQGNLELREYVISQNIMITNAVLTNFILSAWLLMSFANDCLGRMAAGLLCGWTGAEIA